MNYLETTKDFYKEAALEPDKGLCCTTSPVWALPELSVPTRMLDMNYGCGTTVHPRDLVDQPSVLYLGVGGGAGAPAVRLLLPASGRGRRHRARGGDARGGPEEPGRGCRQEPVVP